MSNPHAINVGTHTSPMLNTLLAGLDAEALGRLKPHLLAAKFTAQDVLYWPDEHIKRIYFPDTAVLCMLTVMKDGHTIESATVGSEGASWISASLGAPSMPCQTMVAIGGTGHSIAAEYVEGEVRVNGAFHDALTAYSHALFIHTLRTTACNGLHSLHQRAARWMLLTLDRTSIEDFSVTHEFLASLLGAARPVLTLILGDFERSGAIAISRGSIRVADRSRLERAACECYWVIRENFVTLQEKLLLQRENR